MTEADADRFFGRNEEIAGLLDKLKLHRLVAVVADSGAGKSSLAQAGLVPAFRGGKLSDMAGREPDDRLLWHVVVVRPGRDPVEGLKRGVTEAAERLGCSADQCTGLRKRVDVTDPSETAYAIRCDLGVGKTETLLVVDQFEELLTETMEADTCTVRRFAHDARHRRRVQDRTHAARRPFQLVPATGKPVRMFDARQSGCRAAAWADHRRGNCRSGPQAARPRRPNGACRTGRGDRLDPARHHDRAGDLALVQMALYAMWQKHKADGAACSSPIRRSAASPVR